MQSVGLSHAIAAPLPHLRLSAIDDTSRWKGVDGHTCGRRCACLCNDPSCIVVVTIDEAPVKRRLRDARSTDGAKVWHSNAVCHSRLALKRVVRADRARFDSCVVGASCVCACVSQPVLSGMISCKASRYNTVRTTPYLKEVAVAHRHCPLAMVDDLSQFLNDALFANGDAALLVKCLDACFWVHDGALADADRASASQRFLTSVLEGKGQRAT